MKEIHRESLHTKLNIAYFLDNATNLNNAYAITKDVRYFNFIIQQMTFRKIQICFIHKKNHSIYFDEIYFILH